MPILENPGYCPTCSSETVFRAEDAWLRDHYKCTRCGSIPRERALMHVIETYFPNWRNLVIHESSPVDRGASTKLKRECKSYIPSFYWPARPLGSVVNGARCENLERLTFEDASIDLHVTQDVMEHIFHPDRVFREIARTLRPGGAHVFTVPMLNKMKPTRRRAELGADNQVIHLVNPPVYHGDPTKVEGALMTFDWGFDICRHIFDACGLFTQMIRIDDITKGIRAEYVEVLLTLKPAQ